MENVSALREHLHSRHGLTTVRYFRDKLAMRARAQKWASPCRSLCPSLITML
jgi:hypothetical protein